MKEITMYQCACCGENFLSKDSCLKHEKSNNLIKLANDMLKNGKTLFEINGKFNVWRELPQYLNTVTIENCFTIPHLQCCSQPAYQIKQINEDKKLYLYGKGSWSGYYGAEFEIDNYNLKNPRSIDELFIDKRLV